jgi:hypothetical protein
MEDDLHLEPIERRHSVRGKVPGLLFAREQSYPAEDVSAVSLFVRTDPERFTVGQRLDVTMYIRGRRVACRVEVARREVAPRIGVVMRIVDIAIDAASSLDAALDAARV